jgi:hypothetical protein
MRDLEAALRKYQELNNLGPDLLHVPPLPWWRRLLNGLLRRRNKYSAPSHARSE